MQRKRKRKQKLSEHLPKVVELLKADVTRQSTLEKISNGSEEASENLLKDATIICVLGGPRSGKSTQCKKITKHYGFRHLSVEDFCKKGEESDSDASDIIKENGKGLPSHIKAEILQEEMEEIQDKKFLIDGFPCSLKNLAAYNAIIAVKPKFVLHFNCSEDVLVRRALYWNQGLKDDQIETIEKRVKRRVQRRFNRYYKSARRIIKYFEIERKLCEVNGEKSVEEVFEDIQEIFSSHGIPTS